MWNINGSSMHMSPVCHQTPPNEAPNNGINTNAREVVGELQGGFRLFVGGDLSAPDHPTQKCLDRAAI